MEVPEGAPGAGIFNQAKNALIQGEGLVNVIKDKGNNALGVVTNSLNTANAEIKTLGNQATSSFDNLTGSLNKLIPGQAATPTPTLTQGGRRRRSKKKSKKSSKKKSKKSKKSSKKKSRRSKKVRFSRRFSLNKSRY